VQPADLPLLLRPEPGPATLKVTRWGGQRLAALRGGPGEQGRTVGESWEFSTLPGSESAALGRPLGALLSAPLPFLAKLIDTALPLSVQVHPDDRRDPDHPATMLPGKEEAWVILAADPGARLWAGLRPGLSRDDLARAARAGDPLVACLTEHVAEPGMCVLVPAGTVHAIGGGLLLAEIQQPSDCTYRLYDYGSGRPLHVEQALAATDLAAAPQIWRPSAPPTRLAGKHVTVELLGPGEHRCVPDATPCLLIGVRDRAHVLAGREREPLAPGDLLLARAAPVTVEVPPGGLAAVGSVRD
jgi:mannose-6-phosphate isomerase class I